MISFDGWSEVQRRLLDDPGYLGVRTDDGGALVMCWLPGHSSRVGAAAAASAALRDAGVLVRHEVNDATFAQIEEEEERLMELHSELVPVYELGSDEFGPAAEQVRLNLTIGTGSFRRAADRGTTVFAELAPRVPVTIVEGGQPIVA